MAETETIYALSSGRPPAGVAVVRLSGPRAMPALARIAGRVPEARRATLLALRDPESGELLDHALVLAFPAPRSFTGEDVAELHVHGGSAVIDAVFGVLDREGLRLAAAGEFSRRAFDNGCLDLTQAEGLADLIAAETAAQRLQALGAAGGRLRDRVEDWRVRLLRVSAEIAAALDFADEADVGVDVRHVTRELAALRAEMAAALSSAGFAERLRDGLRIAVVGPPNVGKSSLINSLSRMDAAIVSPVAGTTRDVVEVQLALGGVPVTLVDTAGLRDGADDIEREGIRRARRQAESADFVILLIDGRSGTPALPRPADLTVMTKADLYSDDPTTGFRISTVTGEGLDELTARLTAWAHGTASGAADSLVSNRRQRALLESAELHLSAAIAQPDPVLQAEELRGATAALDNITGRAGVDDMLDALFGAFCIGK